MSSQSSPSPTRFVNRLYIKVALLFVLLAALLITLIFVRRFYLLRELDELSRNYLQAQQTAFQIAHEQTHELINAFRTDYTIWDEMVDAVDDRDRQWFDDNLPIALTTYKTDLVWVFNEKYQSVYSTGIGEQIKDFPLVSLEDSCSSLYRDGFFVEFHAVIDDEVYELMGAPIQPTLDTERSTIPRGYMFVGRKLGGEYLKRISNMTESDVKISIKDVVSEPSLDADDGDIRFEEKLVNNHGAVIAVHQVVTHSDFLERDARMINQQLQLFTAAIVGFTTLMFIILFYYVLRPMRQLSLSLRRNDELLLDRLSSRGDELGDAARLIKRSRHYQRQIDASNNELSIIKQKLETQLNESERVNDLMVDRELKMIELKKQVKDLQAGSAKLKKPKDNK